MDPLSSFSAEEPTPDSAKKRSKKTIVLSIIAGILLLITAYVLIGVLGEKDDSAAVIQGRPPKMGAATGQNADPAYQTLVETRNMEAAQAAAETGGSAVVTPVSSSALEEPEDCSKKIEAMEARMSEMERERQRLLQELARRQQQTQNQGPSVGYDELVDPKTGLRFQSAERFQRERERTRDISSKLVEKWNQAPGFVSTYVQTPLSTATVAQGASTGSSDCVDCPGLAPLIPAGTILYATLSTGINSDIPGIPIMAEVRTGKLKGTRLIGSFARSDQYVVVQFSQGTTPSGQTVRLKGVAIDVGTRLAGVADDVNNHYFLRYGALLGAAFLQGYGEIVRQSLNQVEYVKTAENESTPIQTTKDDTSKAAVGALATVGSELSNQLKKAADRPPTVSMYPGSEIGILVTESVYVGGGN